MRRFFEDLVSVNDCLVPEQPSITRAKLSEVQGGAEAGSMVEYYRQNVTKERVISPSWQWPSQKRLNTQVKYQTVMISLVEVYLIVETLLSHQSLFEVSGFGSVVKLAKQTKSALHSVWPSLALPSGCLSYMLFIKVVMPQDMEHNYLKCSSISQPSSAYVVPTKVKDVLKRIFFSVHSLGLLNSLTSQASLFDIAQFLVTFPYLHSNETDKKGVQLTLLAQYLHSLLPQLPPEYLFGNSIKLYTELMLEYHAKYKLKSLKSERNLELLLVAEHVMEKHLADIASEDKTLKAFKRSSDFFAFILRVRIEVKVKRVKDGQGATRLIVEKATPSPSSPSTVLSFIQHFCTFSEVQRSTEFECDEGGVRAAFAKYLEIMRAKLQEHPQYLHRTQREVDEVFEDLVRYMSRRMFKEVFPPWESVADRAFLTVCEDLDWVRPHHLLLDLPLPNHMFTEAVHLLRSLDDFLSPHSKVLKMVEAVTLVLSEADFWVEMETMEKADTALPYVVLLMVLTQPRRFWSNVNYIAKFWHPVQAEKQPWLCYSLLKSAARLLEFSDASTFHISQASYRELISASRQRHGRS